VAYSVTLAWYSTEFGLRRVNLLFCAKDSEERRGSVQNLWPVNFILQRVSVSRRTYTHTYIYTYIQTYVHSYIHMHAYVHNNYVHAYIYPFVHTHTHTQTHTHSHRHTCHTEAIHSTKTFRRTKIRKAKRTALYRVITQQLVVIYCRRFGTTCRSLPLLAAL
jgi:hypothetical protein